MSIETMPRKNIGRIAVEIFRMIKRWRMPVAAITEFANFSDQIGGLVPAVVLDIEHGPKARDRLRRAGDDGLLAAFDVNLDEMARRKAQAVNRQHVDAFAAFAAQLDTAEISGLAVIRNRHKSLAGFCAGRRLNGANIADLVEREIGAQEVIRLVAARWRPRRRVALRYGRAKASRRRYWHRRRARMRRARRAVQRAGSHPANIRRNNRVTGPQRGRLCCKPSARGGCA